MIDLSELAKYSILGSDEGSLDPDPLTRNIFTVRPDGSDKTYLTNDGKGTTNALASWSYDGSKIVYMHANSASPLPYIWSMDADGSNKKQLTFGSLSGIAPTFSPDGKSILSTSYGESSANPLVGAELWVMNADGTDARPLTYTTVGGASKSGTPLQWSMFGSYSPDGSKIAYSSTQSGSAQIWVMNSDGSEKRELTFIADADTPDANSPSWSPDGTEIAYAGGFAGKGTDANPFTIHLYKIKPDGSERTQLTFASDDGDVPTWSPDGQYIYFGSIRDGPTESWVMRADGSDQKELFQSNYYSSRRPVTIRDAAQATSADTVSDSAGAPSGLFQSSDAVLPSDGSGLKAAQPFGFDFQDITPSDPVMALPDSPVGLPNDPSIVENGDRQLASLEPIQRWDDTGDVGGGSDGPL